MAPPARILMTVILLATAPVVASLSVLAGSDAAHPATPTPGEDPARRQPPATPTPAPGDALSDRQGAGQAPAPASDRGAGVHPGDASPRRSPSAQTADDPRGVPPRPGTEDNGLTVNESAALWSRDSDDFITNEKYRQLYGASRPPLQALANGTDITFAQPPETAARWSRNDFTDLDAGDDDTSVYPAKAELEDGRFIKDAHATIFGVHPSTRGHLTQGTTRLYLAPEGTLRGFVDYRVVMPNATMSGNTSISWQLLTHEIEEVRLKQDGEVIAHTDGTHTPILDYQTANDWRATFTLEADISVTLSKTSRPPSTQCPTGNNTSSCGRNGTGGPTPTDPAVSGGGDPALAAAENATGGPDIDEPGSGAGDVTRVNETVTVTDSLPVEVYNLTAYPHYARYPDGDAGVAIFQSRPWQGYTLGANTADHVRGVWRFYTARDTGWDTLTQSNASDSTTRPSDALPVYVHAYPSEIGPRPAVAAGPQLIETWGRKTAAPGGTIGSSVHVDDAEQPYTRSYGVAVRHDAVDRDALTVYGIVRTTNAALVAPPNGSERKIRASNLTVTVSNQTLSGATLRIELREADTGAPIALSTASRWELLGAGAQHGGYIEIADRRVRTNAAGVAFVRVSEPGAYTARYRPVPWLSVDPAYTGDTASVRWHPLTTLGGWWGLVVTGMWLLLPFGVAWYAGRRLTLMLPPDTHSKR